jgi:hypothetical protein
MAGEINWKSKYQELKSKYFESVDMAFRLGFEQGGQQAQQQAAQEQQAQAQQMQVGGGMGGGMGQEDPNAQPGQDGNGATMPAGPGQGIQQPQDSENPAGSELDQHIAKLDSMVNKSEAMSNDPMFGAYLGSLKEMRKSQQLAAEMKKSQQAIPAIARALHKPAFKMSQQANHNLSSNAKQAVSMQQKIASDVMAQMEKEEKTASKDILAQLGIEGLTKKET